MRDLWCDHLPEQGLPCGISPVDRMDDYAAARSRHPGGVHVTFCDGHVDFYADEVDYDLWQALSTINGQEVIDAP